MVLAGLRDEAPTVILHSSDGKAIPVEVDVASTPDQWSRGLMYRTSLPEDSGMLFVFPYPDVRTFWMKNTLIPLDMLFIAANGTVMEIHHAEPCKSENCEFYSSMVPVLYVLELNGNFTNINNIEKGSEVEIENFNPAP